MRVPITVDASVTSQYPSKPYATYKDMAIESASPIRYAYLWGALPALTGKTVTSGILWVRERYNHGGGSRELKAELAAARFDGKLTYQNRPGVVPSGPTGVLTKGNASDAAGRWWGIPITTLLQAIANGTAWHGIRLSSNNATQFYVWSSEAAADSRPYIELEFSAAPGKPTNLSPAGGRAVSIARPPLRFGFVDTADDYLTGVRIQYATNEAFTTITKDVTDLTAIAPEWIPDEDIAVDATIWWRAYTRDSAGNWSPPSDPATFPRKNKITVTPVSPLNGGTVTESTPPFIDAVSGGTQRSWQNFLLDPVSGAVLHDSGKRDGTETSWTPPPGILTETGKPYRRVRRTWDTISRESVPGDPAYVETIVDFTVELSDSTEPVDSLTVTDLGGGGVRLDAVRTEGPPDGFQLRIGGLFVGDVIDPASILLTSTTFRLDTWAIPPRSNAPVELVAIVNGAASDDNPVVVVNTKPTGVRLSGTDGEDQIMLSNTGEGDWSDTTQSSTHQGIGTPFVSVRTQVLGVPSSRFDGHLTPKNVPEGLTMAQWAARAERLRDPAGQRLRLITPGANFVGTVDRMFVYPIDEYGRVRVEFDFYVGRP